MSVRTALGDPTYERIGSEELFDKAVELTRNCAYETAGTLAEEKGAGISGPARYFLPRDLSLGSGGSRFATERVNVSTYSEAKGSNWTTGGRAALAATVRFLADMSGGEVGVAEIDAPIYERVVREVLSDAQERPWVIKFFGTCHNDPVPGTSSETVRQRGPFRFPIIVYPNDAPPKRRTAIRSLNTTLVEMAAAAGFVNYEARTNPQTGLVCASYVLLGVNPWITNVTAPLSVEVGPEREKALQASVCCTLTQPPSIGVRNGKLCITSSPSNPGWRMAMFAALSQNGRSDAYVEDLILYAQPNDWISRFVSGQLPSKLAERATKYIEERTKFETTAARKEASDYRIRSVTRGGVVDFKILRAAAKGASVKTLSQLVAELRQPIGSTGVSDYVKSVLIVALKIAKAKESSSWDLTERFAGAIARFGFDNRALRKAREKQPAAFDKGYKKRAVEAGTLAVSDGTIPKLTCHAPGSKPEKGKGKGGGKGKKRQDRLHLIECTSL
jgi:hypothetical protein